jgi:cardiolipin synthase
MPDSTRYLRKPQQISHGNEVRLLVDGGQAYPAMLEAIAGARSTVNMETYIFASDETGWRFARALAQSAECGVEVNVLLDGYGSVGCATSLLKYLIEVGVRVTWYKPLAPWRSGWGWWRRDHKKILVVDGGVGFVGGLNIADDYADEESGGRGWRDTHARIAGPVVTGLQESFLRTWRKSRGPRLDPPTHLPALEPVGDADAAILTNRIHKERRQIRKAYLYALKRAQRYIYLTSAYFVPSYRIRRRLRKACARGVDVRILLAGTSDIALVTRAARHCYTKLLKCGVRIYEWAGPMIHAKTAVVDGVWSTVGSCNLDFMSMRYNLESNVVVLGGTFADPLTQLFRQDLERATEIHLAEWRQRSWWQRFLDSLAYRFRKWL